MGVPVILGFLSREIRSLFFGLYFRAVFLGIPRPANCVSRLGKRQGNFFGALVLCFPAFGRLAILVFGPSWVAFGCPRSASRLLVASRLLAASGCWLLPAAGCFRLLAASGCFRLLVSPGLKQRPMLEIKAPEHRNQLIGVNFVKTMNFTRGKWLYL